MKILMIYPKYPETFWSFKHALRFISKKAAFPPLGLLTVASLLPEEWDKRLVDMNITDLKDEEIQWADMIFISGMLVQKESIYEIIDQCKAHNKTIVAGGPAFMARPDQFPSVDHFVLGEGEISLPMFLKDLEQGQAQRVYDPEERPEITNTPLPMWSLIDIKKYATMPVQYSRGCPFNCEFCDIIIMNGRKPRTKTPEQMRSELQALYDAGWRSGVFIVDDNFIGNKRNVKEMLPSVIDWQRENNYPFTILTEASVNLADDQELMDMMTAANFNKVFLGLETPCMESLKECGKTQNTRRDLSEVVQIIHRNGMQVMAGFILGFDHDTESIFEAQIKFIQQIGVVTAMVGILGAIPKTRLWYRLKSEGRLLRDSSGDNTDGSVNFIPKMGIKRLLQGYQRVITTIYSPREYYDRIHTFVKYYQPRAKGHVSKEDLVAFWKSVWRIGVFSRYSLLYWKLVLKTSFTKLKALPAAIELAIYGYHFERVAKKAQEAIKKYEDYYDQFTNQELVDSHS